MMFQDLASIGDKKPAQYKELKEQLEELDLDTKEGRDVYRKAQDLEGEMKHIWFGMLRRRGDEVPLCMGRSAHENSAAFVEEY